MSVLEQVIAFFLVTTWGNLVGFLFDCYRTLRQIWRLGYWSTSLGDLAFWLVITVFTYVCLMLITWGEVRFYVFLGIGLGLFLYLKFFSKTMRRYLLKLYEVIIKILLIIVAPFKRVFNFFKPPLDPPKDSS